METQQLPNAVVGSRRNEDIALDLLKFVAAYTDFAKSAAGVGFQTPGSGKSSDQVDRLLELYGRCLKAIEGKK